jgi:RNA polymerase sigma-70 factor (ECF subfamily)
MPKEGNVRLENLSDNELVGLILEKNEDAATRFVELYDRDVRVGILKVWRDADSEAVDELVQVSFIKALKGLPLFTREKSRVSTWITRIAMNATIDFMQSRKSHERVEAGYRYISPRRSSFQVSQEQVAAYREALKSFSEADQTVWKMYADGTPSKEIAQALSVSPESVRIKVMRMKNKLIEMLQQYKTNRAKRISRGRAEAILKAIMVHCAGRRRL